MTWRSELTAITRRTAVVATCIAMLCHAALAQNVNAPTWNAIERSGDEVNYFAYYNGAATEIAQSTGFGGSATHSQLLSTSRPPIYYTVFGGSSGATRSVCQITNQPSKPIYWYSNGSNSATALAGDYPTAPSDAFSVSTSLSSTKGLEFRGAFDGSGSVSGSGAYMVETVYLSDRPCTDGGFEYGFFRRVQNSSPADTIAFYYSDFTNCDGGICRQTNSNMGTVESPNFVEHDITNLPATNSGGQDDQWIFHAYPVLTGGVYDMRFEVLDPITLGYAQCSVDGGTTGNCFKEYTPSAWSESFGNFSGMNGYVFSGTQSVGTVTQSPDFIIHVEVLNIGN